MRELRDRAQFAPSESRYRVFIIDEAHMITPSGSNALLKVVEEPPEHLIFIFATTEPEKIIGTIRSRTHNYPFRLLSPQSMKYLLQRTVAAEGVFVDEAVYPLVIRAGGGSPRDTLSLLDQLLSGAGPDGLTYEAALPLLGVTDLTLLDSTVEALAANDKATLFTTINTAIDQGIEPQRFIRDLLDRLRDLMVLQAVPDAIERELVDALTDRADVLRAQSARFTGPQIVRLTDEVNKRIVDLRGATSPRLLLEILFAHLIDTEGPRTAPLRTSAASEAAHRPAREAPPQSPATIEKPRPATIETLREQWEAIKAEVQKRNQTAGILLAEAQVAALEGDKLVLHHHTGALASLLNAERNNKDVRAVVSEKLERQITVECTVGTAAPRAEETPAPQAEETPAPQQEAAPTPQQQQPPASLSAAVGLIEEHLGGTPT